MRISDWSSDVCSSDLVLVLVVVLHGRVGEFVELGLVHRVGGLGTGSHVGDLAFVAGAADGNTVVTVGIRARPEGNRVVARGLAARTDRDRAFGVCQRVGADGNRVDPVRSEEHTSELQSLMRISYAVFCLKKTI